MGNVQQLQVPLSFKYPVPQELFSLIISLICVQAIGNFEALTFGKNSQTKLIPESKYIKLFCI